MKKLKQLKIKGGEFRKIITIFLKNIMNKKEFIKNGENILETIYDKLENLQILKKDELNPKKTMAFSIDINNGFAKKGALYSPRTEKLIPDTYKLLKELGTMGVTLLAYTDTHTSDSPELESYPEHCMLFSDESEVVDELKSIEGLTIKPKNSTNGFLSYNPLKRDTFDNKTQNELDQMENFIITGVCTDICVYQFALSLKTYLNENNRKGRVIIPRNLVDTFDAPYHNAEFLNSIFLDSLINNGIEVVQKII